METVNELLKATKEEIAESKKVLESLVNDVMALTTILDPQLMGQIRKIRDSRMAIVREVHDALQAMQDIRKFLGDPAYQADIERLQGLVSVCKGLMDLKASGVLDAVLESALGIALRRDKIREGQSAQMRPEHFDQKGAGI